MRTTSVCYGNFLFESAIPKTLDGSYVQSSFSTITTAFERHVTIEDFTDMNQHRCQVCTKTFVSLLYASFFL